MRVSIILNEEQRIHKGETGEPIMCDQMPWPPTEWDRSPCGITADLELRRWSSSGKMSSLWLCRTCADELARQIREACELLDTRDISGWTKEQQ
jgi:hypothetical protein